MMDDQAIRAIVDIAQQSIQPKAHPHADGLPFVVLVDPTTGAQKIETLPTQLQPLRHKGMVKLLDVDSFKTYVGNLKAAQTRIYGSMVPSPRFIAVFNDHSTGVPGYRDFRAEFTVPFSREWTTWTKSDRQRKTQLEFAEWLEDNLPDVQKPTGAELLEIILDFEASKTGTFRSAQRLQDGSINFVWADQTAGRDGGQIRLPAAFVVSIPVFENRTPAEITARLKYRLNDGSLQLWYELVRPHKIVEAELKEIWSSIEELGLQVLLGYPE